MTTLKGMNRHSTSRPVSHLASRPVSRAALALALAALLLSVLAMSGCGPSGGLSDRYVAEKLVWQARKLERAMAENPELATDEMRDRLRSTYEEIVRLFPPPEGDGSSMSDLETDVARISGGSRMRLAFLSSAAGDTDEAQRLLGSVYEGYAFSRSLALEAAFQLARSYETSGMHERAAGLLDEITDRWPPAESREAMPDARVLRAPLLAASSRAKAGVAEPGQAMERARGYYRGLLRDWAGTNTGRAALGTLAESYESEGRWADAVVAYERLDREYGREDTQASLWLKLAELYAIRLGDTTRSLDYYRSIEETHGDGFEGGSASIALARFDLGERRYDRGRERLESVLSRFADEGALAATAAHLLAFSFESEGRMDSAISRYGELANAYPTTLYGLQAPLHAVDLYAAMGEDAAASAALDRAVDHYERIIRDYGDTPAELAARNHLLTAMGRQRNWSELADLLVETATRFPGTGAAPAMLLQAAVLYETRLVDEDAARQTLRILVNTFEGSEEAAEAARQLERLDG